MAHALTPEHIQHALHGISVPPQPQVMVDLQMEQYMPDPDLAAIGKLIALDPGLAGAVLKVVNASHLAQTGPVASITQAVTLLGTASVIELINAQSIKGEMTDETIVTLNRFWDNAQDVAATCAALARQLGGASVDDAYALGLFHDAGVPLMLKRFPGYMGVLEQAYAQASEHWRVVDTENRAFSTNHAVVGYYAARAWRLGSPVCGVIASHHNAAALLRDPSPRSQALKPLLALLKMAEHICASHQVLAGEPVDHEWNHAGAMVLDYVGLSEYDFDHLKETLRELTAR